MKTRTKGQSFARGASVLALASLGAKFLGACYRIPLTNLLGAEGMGLYQLVFPVFSFLLSASSGALPIAISMLLSRGEVEDNRKTLAAALLGLSFSGILGGIALAGLSPVLARLQGNAAAAWGYVAIAPSVLLVAGIAAFRGWFQGHRDMTPSALSQISESLVKLAAGLVAAWALKPLGLTWAVAGALAATTLSEAVTLFLLYVRYRKENPKLHLRMPISEVRAKWKNIFKITLPITIGGMILPVTQMADSFLVVNILSRFQAVAEATADYGVWTGPVGAFVNLPVALALALGVAVVPQMAKGRADRDIVEVKTKAGTAIKTALAIGVPFTVMFLFASAPILRLFYPALSAGQIALGAKLLRISAINVVSLSLMQIFTSILQGLDETYPPVVHLAIGGAVKIVLDVALLYAVGIEGVAYSSMAAFALVAVLNGLTLRRLVGKSGALGKNSSAIVVSGVIMGIAVGLGCLFVPVGWAWAAVPAAGAALYAVCLIASDVFHREEWLALPFGRVLWHLNRRWSLSNRRNRV